MRRGYSLAILARAVPAPRSFIFHSRERNGALAAFGAAFSNAECRSIAPAHACFDLDAVDSKLVRKRKRSIDVEQ